VIAFVENIKIVDFSGSSSLNRSWSWSWSSGCGRLGVGQRGRGSGMEELQNRGGRSSGRLWMNNSGSHNR